MGRRARVPGRQDPRRVEARRDSGLLRARRVRLVLRLVRQGLIPAGTGPIASPYFVLGRQRRSTYTHVRLASLAPSGLVWLATWPSTLRQTDPVPPAPGRLRSGDFPGTE